jgi:hypothetical protein
MFCWEEGDMAQVRPDADRALWEWMKVRLAAGRGGNVNANRSEQWRARDRVTTAAISIQQVPLVTYRADGHVARIREIISKISTRVRSPQNDTLTFEAKARQNNI